MQDRNISGTFNNEFLGNSYTQHQAGVNSWDTSTSAQTKIAVENIKKYGVLPAKEVKKDVKDGFSYKLFYRIAKMMKK